MKTRHLTCSKVLFDLNKTGLITNELSFNYTELYTK